MLTMHRRWPVLLAFLAVLFFSAPLVRAQDRDDYRDRGFVQGQNRAYENGYRRGENRGRDDARHERAFDYGRDKDYRNGDDGYNRRYGDRDWYRDQYRRGYVEGYTRSYRLYAPRGYDRDDLYSYPRYDGRAVPRPYAQYGLAVNAGYNKGYNDGLDKGRDDWRHDRRFDPDRHNWYRDADRGWSRLLGTRSEYAAAYRQGFLNGYRAAYGQRGDWDRR